MQGNEGLQVDWYALHQCTYNIDTGSKELVAIMKKLL